MPTWEKLSEDTVPLCASKSSYALGPSQTALPGFPGAVGTQVLLPPDYNPAEELRFITQIARALLRVNGALRYFNPNGETLHSAAFLKESIEYHEARAILPLEVWSNVRVLRFPQVEDWIAMDTVGMEQLGVADHEACFPSEAFDRGEVDHFLRNSTAYVLQNGPIIQDGDTMNGPGGMSWRAQSCDESLGPPPRDTLRWRPSQGVRPPACFGFEETQQRERGRWWQRWKK